MILTHDSFSYKCNTYSLIHIRTVVIHNGILPTFFFYSQHLTLTFILMCLLLLLLLFSHVLLFLHTGHDHILFSFSTPHCSGTFLHLTTHPLDNHVCDFSLKKFMSEGLQQSGHG